MTDLKTVSNALGRAGAPAVLALLMLAVALGVADNAKAQGALSLTADPAHLSTNGSTGVSFDIIAGPTPLRIYRLGCAGTTASTVVHEIWWRPSGGISSVYPPVSTSFNTTGWINLGSASTTHAVANVIDQIPLTLNVVVPANTRVGFAIIGSIRYHNTAATMAPPTTMANADMTIDYMGWAGGSIGTGPAGSIFTRAFKGTVWYDYDQFTGTAMSVTDANVNSGTGLTTGNNTVNATVRNMGTAALDNTPIHAEYSTDAGTTWVGTQIFSFPSFPPLSNQTLTFTLPWAVPAVAVRELQVRLVTPITPVGQGIALKTRTFTPDLDLESPTITPTAALNTPLTVGFTARNNGGWNFNGLSFNARYTIDGSNFVTLPFVPTTLPVGNSTQVMSFTTPLLLTVAGSYNLGISVFPQYAGDPDTTDAVTLPMNNVGFPSVTYAPTAGLAGTLGVPIYRSASAATAGSVTVAQMIYDTTQLASLPPGVIMKSIEFFKANDHGSAPGTAQTLRVWLENTTATTFAASATYADFATTSTLVYQSTAWVMPAATGWLNFGPFNQPAPFIYTGGNLIISVEWNSQGALAPVTVPGISGATSPAWQYEAITLNNSGRSFTSTANPVPPTQAVTLNSTGSPHARRPHARFFYEAPSAVDLDVAGISFGTTAPLGAAPALGSNTVNATIRTLGSQAFTTSFQLQYSTDGGNNWISNVAFTASGLNQAGNSQTVAFSTPWVLPSLATPATIRVRIFPQPAGDPDTVDELNASFNGVDADVDSISTTPQSPVANQPATVKAVIKNNGQFSFNGSPINLRYSVDGGTTWVPQQFTPTTLGGNNATQEFSFTTPWILPAPGSPTLQVQIFPQVTGDPDTGDSLSKTFINAGYPRVQYGNPSLQTPAAQIASRIFPLYRVSAVASQPWSLYGAIYHASELNIPVGMRIVDLEWFKINDAATLQNNLTLEIWLRNTTETNYTANTTWSAHMAKPGWVQVVNTTTAGIPATMEWTRLHTFNTPNQFIYSGQNLEIFVFGNFNGNTTSAETVATFGTVAGTPPGCIDWTFEPYAGTTTDSRVIGERTQTTPLPTQALTTSAFQSNNLRLAHMRVTYEAPSDPGFGLARGTANIPDQGTDDLASSLTAAFAQNLSYTVRNLGQTQALNITAINITGQSNCTASVTTSPVGTPVATNGTANLVISVTPGAGPWSFNVEAVNNSQVTTLQSYTWTVSGTGFVNTAPQIVMPIVGTGLQATGTHPNYEVSIVSGTPITMTVRATDVDTFQNLNLSMDVATTGSTITPALAGFTTTFPATATVGTSPRNIVLAGTANTPGIVVFTATVQDNGLNPLSDTVTITFKVGARLDVTTAATVSQFVRVSGQKDFYRGQTGMAVDIKVSNNNPFAIRLDSLALQVAPTAGGGPVSGITFALLGSPVLLPANATNVVIPCTMDIAANAGGTNNMPCRFTIPTGVAVNPAAPTDPVVIFVTAPVDNIVLFDGPVPQPMQITLNAFNPAVETVPYLQNLTVSGGLGSYTWSIPTTSANQLPTGLVLDPQGSQFLPAKISGTAALGTAILGPYTITLQVSDTAYLATKTLTLNVSALTPLTFPPVTLASGQEYVAYSMTTPFTATGGSLIYTFGVDPSSVDQLPTGLTLNPQTGVISGTPADGTQRSYSITFMLDDGQSQLTQTQTLVINPHPLQWRGTTLPTATQTVSYSEALDAIGGTGPRIYSIESGTLPNGLSLNASNGVILGIPSLTPNSVGTYNMEFKVTDGLNASVNQAITITVVPAPPLVVTTSVLEYGMVGATYASAIAVTGGSQSYVISVASSSAAQLPAGLTLAPNGDITGTPEVGSDGRYAIDISVNDGFQTIFETVILPVIADGSRGVAITEVDAGTGYIELANSDDVPVDVSGWSVTIWVDSNSPISLPFDSIPGASLALPAEVVTITLGGTAGGFWPSYNTGGTWTGTSTSNISVLLSDIHGNTIDFVSFGTANRASLVDSANAAIDLPAPLNTMANANNGAANYSYNGTAWVGSANGTPGVYNTGLAAFPLMIIKDALRTANSGQAFSDFTLAIGGRAPYAFTLTAPAAPWLSLSTNGVFSGTAPTVATPTTINVDVTVTDALTAAVTETFEIRIAPASTTPSATFTVGNAEGQSFEGTVIDVPVTMTRASGVTDVQGFSFVIELAAPTALELDVVRVLPGPAVIAAGRTVVARDLGNNRIFVGDYGADNLPAANFADGVVAIVRFMVPVDNNVMAPEATYGVSIADTEIGRAATGVHTATGVNGSMILSNYKPQDVNRDTAIDVVDVQQTVNIILSLFTPTYPGQGDANSDNAVDVVDVQTIVNCILLGGC